MNRSKVASNSAQSAVWRSSVSKRTCTHTWARRTAKWNTLPRHFKQRGEGTVRSTLDPPLAIAARRKHRFPFCHCAQRNGAGERCFRDNWGPYNGGLVQPQCARHLLSPVVHVLLRPLLWGLLRKADVLALGGIHCTLLSFLHLRPQEVDDVGMPLLLRGRRPRMGPTPRINRMLKPLCASVARSRQLSCPDMMRAEVWTPRKHSKPAAPPSPGFEESVRRLAHTDATQSKATTKAPRHLCTIHSKDQLEDG